MSAKVIPWKHAGVVLIASEVICFTVLVSMCLWYWFGQDRVVRRKFEQIALGMSEADVSNLLGGPPGDYGTGYFHQVLVTGPDLFGNLKGWIFSENWIIVGFDEDNKVH
jgi:hypothetical protein